MKRLKWKTALAVIFGLTVAAGLSVYYMIPQKGTVQTINCSAWWDSLCTRKVTDIDWGSVFPNETYKKTFYIRNELSVPGNISFWCNNWKPENVSKYLKVELTEVKGLPPLAVIPVEMTLTVFKNVTELLGSSEKLDFSFDSYIACLPA